MWFKEIAQIIKAEFKPQGYRITTKVAPYPLAWLNGVFDPVVRQVLQLWGFEFKVNNQRVKFLFVIFS